LSDPRAADCAAAIVAAFARYNAEFRAISRRAPERFENRDWSGSQADVVERLELYATAVNSTVADMRKRLGDSAHDTALSRWKRVADLWCSRWFVTDPPPPVAAADSLALTDADGHARPLEEIEAEVIRSAIARYRGQMSEVARRLRIGRSTLYRKLDEIGIGAADSRGGDENVAGG